jgi:hypothetical protein
MKLFPRVLVISVDPFHRSDNTGITLSNLFDRWDKNCIGQVYLSNTIPETDVCENYYKLSPKIAYLDFYCRKLLTLFLVKTGKNNAAPAAVTLTSDNRTSYKKIHLNSRAIADFSSIALPRNLFAWINKLDPEIIYCPLGSIRMLTIANDIAKKIQKPIVPHFMDDWPNTLYTQNELVGLARIIFKNKFKKMLSRSNGGLCISELMAKEYQSRYSLPFTQLGNCVDDILFCSPSETYPNNNIIVLMYIGGLHLDRWKSLLDVSKSLEIVNKEEKKIVLKIFCPQKDIESYSRYFKDLSSSNFEGSIKSNEIPERLKKASLVLHVESFDDNIAKYTKYSLSTKIPQYMAAGKAILAYGPGNIASIQHIITTGAGKVVSENNIQGLVKAFNEVLNQRTSLHTYAVNGFNYAKNYHSKSYNLNQLILLLNKYKLKKNTC